MVARSASASRGRQTTSARTSRTRCSAPSRSTPERPDVDLEVTFDVDASATAGLIVRNRANGRERRWQLNHLYTKLSWW
jgi:hypothetical protein